MGATDQLFMTMQKVLANRVPSTHGIEGLADNHHCFGELSSCLEYAFSMGRLIAYSECMRKLTIPAKLAEEFATIDAVYHSSGSTRRVDALLLAWIKYEKQLRKLFCFFVYQHPNVTRANITDMMDAMATNRDLNPTTLEACIAALGVTPVPTLVGNRHATLKKEIDRIKKYRNKLMHGQISGQSIQSAQLERDVIWIIDWMSTLADGADQAFGYDGLRRNTFLHAKQKSVVVQSFPFNDGKTFDAWLKAQT